MTKRLIALFLLLLFAFPLSSFAEDEEIDILYTGVVTKNMTVRKTKSTSAKKLESVEKDETVDILELGDQWFKVVKNGEVGYILARNVVKIQAAREGVEVPMKYFYEEFIDVYTAKAKKDLSVRQAPSKEAKMVATVYEDEEIIVSSVGETWAHVKKGKKTGYVLSEYLNRFRAIDPYLGLIPGAVWYPYAAKAVGDVQILNAENPDEVFMTMPEGSIVCVDEPDDKGNMRLPYLRTTGIIAAGSRITLEPVKTWDAAQPGDLIGVFATFYEAGDQSELGVGRVHNMREGVQRLQDVIIKEGENFSFNDYCAPYSARNGYELGPIINYVSSKKTGYGGGICQVSTTLYNVLLQIPAKIVKEQPHSSYGIDYAPIDFDAAVGQGNIDLRFQNMLPYDIRMALQLTDGVVTVMIYRADAG